MKLAKYFDDKPFGEKGRFAKKIGVTPTWLGLILNGSRRPSPMLAKKIEKATKGLVTAKELRPDLWAK